MFFCMDQAATSEAPPAEILSHPRTVGGGRQAMTPLWGTSARIEVTGSRWRRKDKSDATFFPESILGSFWCLAAFQSFAHASHSFPRQARTRRHTWSAPPPPGPGAHQAAISIWMGAERRRKPAVFSLECDETGAVGSRASPLFNWPADSLADITDGGQRRERRLRGRWGLGARRR